MSTRSTRLAVIAVVFVVAFSVVTPSFVVAQDKVRVAVMNFDNNSTRGYWGDRLGAAAADELATQLVRSGRFTVIERREIDSVLAEQDFGASGRVSASTAADIGKVIGAQLMVTGSITQFSVETKRVGIGGIGGSYTEAESIVDVRVVNTVTSEIMVAAEGKGKKRMVGLQVNDVSFEQNFDVGVAQEALRPAIEEAVEEIVAQARSFEALKPVMPPASVVGHRGDDYYIDRGENVGITVGQRFAVMSVVDEIKDAQGNVLDQITDRTGLLEVTRVLGQSSICRLVEGSAAEGDSLTAQ